MHGTPYYPEKFETDIKKSNYKSLGYIEDQVGMSSVLIEKFKVATKDATKLIFNSKKAQKQWGMSDDPRAQTIWHGMKAEEWYDLPKEPRVITMISPGGLDQYYDRTFLKAVKEELLDRNISHCHITVDVRFSNWEEYRQFLGRSLIYFNPTKHSPMPRARTEAMFSGCCIVTTLNQDSDEFIEDGVNGLKAIRNPIYVADLIEGLISDYKKAVEIGQKGKETALKIFNHNRYMNDWIDVLGDIMSKR